jgi:hypothetical protein
MISTMARSAKGVASSCMIVAGNVLLVTMVVLGSNLV